MSASLRQAATVILVRGREVFWVRRGEHLSFSGGFYAFPGGKVDRDDSVLPTTGPGTPHHAAALRELFEETGVLVAAGGTVAADTARALRLELLAGASFAALLEREGLRLDASGLVPAGRWCTPPFLPVRFDTRFFVLPAPGGCEPEVLEGELVTGEWISPAAALAQWEEGRVLLHPPTLHVLATLAGFPLESAIPRLRRPPFVDAEHVASRLEFQRGILVLPLRTPTIPPATHTNCYILGTGELAVVDPGSPYPEEKAALFALLDELVSEGRRVRAVLLTHAHVDHTGAALDVAERYRVPVLASAGTASRFPGADGALSDGDVLPLDGPLPMTFRALLTEGHCHGHLAFVEERSRAVIAGDLVASHSTIVIDPADGDLATYLESLSRLEALPAGTLYPAHGVAMPNGVFRLRELRRHREQRLVEVLGALEAGDRDAASVVRRVYTDTPPAMHALAERSVLASLLELARRGQALEEPSGWKPLVPGP